MTQQSEVRHDHHHPHDHPHEHELAENPHAGEGAVVLDIGGDIGAIVVTMPAETVGEEVEILPAGTVGIDEPGHRPHVAVVDRQTPGGRVPSLVFPGLVAGRYDLMPKGTDDVRLTVGVRGAEVTTACWPA